MLILNTNDENIIIKSSKLKTENLEDFDIVEFNKEDKQRNEIVLEKLKQNFSKQFYKNQRIPHSQKQINRSDIVEPSTSSYNSPLLLVPKKSLLNSKDKRWRLVIDYRQVNKKLIADNFPLPITEDILRERAIYFP